jgi:hypothetical protein
MPLRGKNTKYWALPNTIYFCAKCVDCCLIASTFDKEPDGCALNDELEPGWIKVEHPYLLSESGWLLYKLHEAFRKMIVKKGEKHAVIEAEPLSPGGGNVMGDECLCCERKISHGSDFVCDSCKASLFKSER